MLSRSLLIAFVFLVLGMRLKQFLFMVLSSLAFLFSGYSLLNGLAYTVGYSVVVSNATTTTVSSVAAVYTNTISVGMSWFLILTGVALIMISIVGFFQKTEPEREYDEPSEE